MAPATPKAAKRQGFSLVELMIALVAGLIVSGAVLSFFLSSMKSNGQYVQSTRLSQELRNTIDLMTRDLERAGYDQDALKYLATGTPTPFNPIKLDKVDAADPALDCVIYSYDKANAAAGSQLGQLDLANGEIHALRRVSATNQDGKTVGVIEYFSSDLTPSPYARPSCTAAGAVYTSFPPDCNATTGWCALSDPAILDITALTLTDNRVQAGVSPNLVQLRKIGIDLRGRIAGSGDPARNMVASVRVRSDCYNATLANCNNSP